MFRHSFRLFVFSWFTLTFLIQSPGAAALAAPDNSTTFQPAAITRSFASLSAAEDTGTTYLNKLFGNFGPSIKSVDNSAGSASLAGPVEWFLIIFGTIVYGQIALLVVLWILFTSDLLGIIVGLLLIGICLAFTLPRKPRAIALFVLACLNFILGTGITLVVAFTEGVPTVLISLIPLGTLVWLALRQVNFHFTAAVKS